MPRLASALAAAVLFGSAAAAPVPRDADEDLYHPTRVGTRWVYVTSGKGKADEEVTVLSAAERRDGAWLVTLDSLDGDGAVDVRVRMEVSAGGLRAVWRDAPKPEDISRTALKLPFRPGLTWQIGTDETLTAFGPDWVKFSGGESEAIRVVQTRVKTPGRSFTRWYARGVGLVKTEGYGMTTTLKSFTLGPAKP